MIDALYNFWGRILSARQRYFSRRDPLMVSGIKMKVQRPKERK